MLDAIIVTVVVACAVGYLIWSFIPRKNRKPTPCAACPRADEHHPVALLKSRPNS